jgi:hypothetical protein
MKNLVFAFLMLFSASLFSTGLSSPDWIVGSDGWVYDDGDCDCLTFIDFGSGDVSHHGDC